MGTGGRIAVSSGLVALNETRLQPACGERASKTFKHSAPSKPQTGISQLN